MTLDERNKIIAERSEQLVRRIKSLKNTFASATKLGELVGTDVTESRLQELKEIFESLSHNCRQYNQVVFYKKGFQEKS